MPSPFSILKLRRQRRSSRGAALVEAIVVSIMLMTMMAGGLFFHRLYAAQHTAIERARLDAWSRSNKGCDPSPIGLKAIFKGGGEQGMPDITNETPPSYFGAVGHTSSDASQTATASERLGIGSYTLTVNHTVACNEITQSDRGDITDVFSYVSDNLIPF